jgi:hypothetical protein
MKYVRIMTNNSLKMEIKTTNCVYQMYVGLWTICYLIFMQ